MPHSMAASIELSFPTDEADFDDDERISFSKLDNKYIAVHDDGTEFEFDQQMRRWLPLDEEPLEDEQLLAEARYQQLAHGAEPGFQEPQSNKRKNGPSTDNEVSCAVLDPVQLDGLHVVALAPP
jgi:HIV Tat-specific factor 1